MSETGGTAYDAEGKELLCSCGKAAATSILGKEYQQHYCEECFLRVGIRRMSGWRPIETAPKDGTIFIGFERNGRFGMQFIRWCSPPWDEEDPPSWQAVDNDGDIPIPTCMVPTHWMSLPVVPDE